MGDRANVYVHAAELPGVYLYTHWDGTELPQVVQAALASQAGQNRSHDDQYLSRIIFAEMTGRAPGDETGFGISAYLVDGHDRIVDVDTEAMKVTLKVSYQNDPDPEFTFDSYVDEEGVDWTTGA